MSNRTCPTCGKSFSTDESTAMPFCSPRCKQIDLGRWLDEKQKVPFLRLDEDEEEQVKGDSPAD